MSLLDDVSIVVTPNGYKAGELYAVIPVPTEGAEIVVNGDFATDTNWTKGTNTTISGGLMNFSNATSGSYQTGVTTSSIYYKVTYSISNYSIGTIGVTLNGTPAANGIIRNSNGTFTEIIQAPVSSFGTLLFNAVGFTGSIDNVSVKEYTSADMDVTRATAATRVDENGLVNYAEVLGGEEVTNGDFATDLSGWSFGGTSAANTIVWR